MSRILSTRCLTGCENRRILEVNSWCHALLDVLPFTCFGSACSGQRSGSLLLQWPCDKERSIGKRIGLGAAHPHPVAGTTIRANYTPGHWPTRSLKCPLKLSTSLFPRPSELGTAMTAYGAGRSLALQGTSRIGASMTRQSELLAACRCYQTGRRLGNRGGTTTSYA